MLTRPTKSRKYKIILKKFPPFLHRSVKVEVRQMRQQHRQQQTEHADGDRPIFQRTRHQLFENDRKGKEQASENDDEINFPAEQRGDDLRRAHKQHGVEDEKEKET